MSSNPQLVDPNAGGAAAAAPSTERIVTVEVLRHYRAVDATAFSGESNPTSIWEAMLTSRAAAYKYYADIQEKDAHAAAMLEVRKTGVLKRAREVVAVSDAPEDKRRAQFVQQALDRIPDFESVLEDLLEAPAMGVTIHELLWEITDAVWLADVLSVPQAFFCFGDPWDESQTGALKFLGPWGYTPRDVLPWKFVVFSFRPRNGNRRGRPLLRSIFWYSWAKRQITRFMLQHAEKGNGTLAVMYPSGAGDDEKDKALTAAEVLYTEPYGAIPENFKIAADLLASVRSGSVPDYLARIEKLDAYISRRIVGQTLTTQGSEGGAGSRALGSEHAETEEDIQISDAKRVMRVVNQQIVKPLMLFNEGPGVPLPTWQIDCSRSKDLDRELRVQTGLADHGVEIPLSHVKKTFAIPEKKPGEEVLAARAEAIQVALPEVTE